MRKLKIIEHISLDGVIQMTSSPEDDFPYGDWTAPYRSPAGLQIVNEMYGKTCDLLFGRRTYDILASFWPKAPKSPMTDRLNAATKYVVTHRPESLEWGPFEAIGSDLVDNVRRIKARKGPDLIVAGSSTLISVLLDNGLADEVVMLVNPIVLGKGKRFFEGGSLPRGFALGSTMALPSGILVNVYKLIPTLAEEALSRAKLEREFEIAREVQERLFPQTFPKVAGVEMAAHCRPAQAVGGDYYDLIDIRESSLAEAGHAPGENISSASGTTAHGCDRLGIAIGDVSGKGMSAALLMASLHASLRGQVLSGAGDLGTKIANVNRLLYNASDSNRYATFFYAELDCASRTLHYVNGGHNPPAVLRKEDGAWRVLRLGDGGPVIGLLAGALYKEQILHLLSGDILLAFTDGISEAMNVSEDEWGEDRMIAEAQAHADLNAEELLQHLFRAADAFAAGATQHDDMTIVVLRL
ncbi:SpoIIE family protein phosphatase [Tunturiibacter gelidoferens]|jgi:serine phosphatase RsbU (regulator of sigma subunit)/dihydrofolate reductase|uniref:Serine phosphatase RsbU (Regulator of sigma subunit) n=1 Tax=Tunturiibacter gelidiferens TaxID=3069689 RepID=A0A9X0QIS1_9BACT|nr:SpoIIE family protein phosphatase [Edaphobacter lichenicola]MBB5331100.1 serine phosphatase RsbU (regulator of sigma subunit) [Edaphobacter lichenicola]